MAARLVVLVFLHARRALCAFGLSLLVAAAAHAGTNTWSTTAFTGEMACHTDSPSIGAAIACHSGADLVTPPAVACGSATLSNSNFSDTTPPINYTIQTRRFIDATTPFNCGNTEPLNATWTFTVSCPEDEPWDAEYGGCAPPPTDCSGFEGEGVDRFFSGAVTSTTACVTPPGSEDGACVANIVGAHMCAGAECYGRLEYTGGSCSTGVEPENDEGPLVDEPGTVNCVSGDGVTYCAKESSRNCGTVNGESVCLDTIPPGRCTFLGNGGMVCASDVGAPPAPTESDGETPASPDGEFAAGGDDVEYTTYNYFGPGTVASSGSASSGSGQGPSTDGGGDGEEPGAGPCEEPGSCPGVLPTLEEADSFADSTSAFLAGVEASPIVAAISGLGASMPAGECPAPEVTLPYLADVTLVLDAHCDLWDSIAGVLAAVMLAVWVFIGARIFLSA